MTVFLNALFCLIFGWLIIRFIKMPQRIEYINKDICCGVINGGINMIYLQNRDPNLLDGYTFR